MNTRCLSIFTVLATMFAVGCAHNPERVLTRNRKTVAALNATANDEAADPDKRCRAVFSLFQQFIKPGSLPSELHEVLTDTRWLAQTNVNGVYVLAGWIPVDWEFGQDQPFVVFVLPELIPTTGRPPNLGYHIYFTLGGEAFRSEESAFQILSGQQTWDSKAVLKEFALCYPDGTIEHVTKSGSRKFNMLANHALQRTAAGHRSCIQRASWPPSLSLGR